MFPPLHRIFKYVRLIGHAMFGATFNLVTRVALPLFMEH